MALGASWGLGLEGAWVGPRPLALGQGCPPGGPSWPGRPETSGLGRGAWPGRLSRKPLVGLGLKALGTGGPLACRPLGGPSPRVGDLVGGRLLDPWPDGVWVGALRLARGALGHVGGAV